MSTPEHDETMARLEAATVGEVERRDVVLVGPDPAWPDVYVALAERIRTALGATVIALHHVGSTSVPDLSAKPIIDVVLVVADPADEDSYVPALEAVGWELRLREPGWYEHRVLKPGTRDANLHVFGPGCEEVERMLAFRDHLRRDRSDRELYAATKRRLASQDWPTVQHYADAKTDVVRDILTRALR